MELYVFGAVVLGVFLYVFWKHPARLRRPSIAEEMLTKQQTIEQTLDHYLGKTPPTPTDAEPPPPVAELAPLVPTVLPKVEQPHPPKKQAPPHHKPAFNLRDFVMYNIIWNRKY